MFYYNKKHVLSNFVIEMWCDNHFIPIRREMFLDVGSGYSFYFQNNNDVYDAYVSLYVDDRLAIDNYKLQCCGSEICINHFFNSLDCFVFSTSKDVDVMINVVFNNIFETFSPMVVMLSKKYRYRSGFEYIDVDSLKRCVNYNRNIIISKK